MNNPTVTGLLSASRQNIDKHIQYLCAKILHYATSDEFEKADTLIAVVVGAELELTSIDTFQNVLLIRAKMSNLFGKEHWCATSRERKSHQRALELRSTKRK